MKSSKVAYGKAKGRELQNWTCQQISDLLGIPWGRDEEIAARPMGNAGVDVMLSKRVRELFPFSVECKSEKTISIGAYIKQAKDNQIKGTDWLVVAKRKARANGDRIPEFVVMDALAFFKLLGRIND